MAEKWTWNGKKAKYHLDNLEKSLWLNGLGHKTETCTLPILWKLSGTPYQIIWWSCTPSASDISVQVMFHLFSSSFFIRPNVFSATYFQYFLYYIYTICLWKGFRWCDNLSSILSKKLPCIFRTIQPYYRSEYMVLGIFYTNHTKKLSKLKD